MRHINTKQIDNHLWELVVTDGFHTQWTAYANGAKLEIWMGENTSRKPAGIARLENGYRESNAIGEAMALVFNWAQQGICCNEPLDTKWVVQDENLVHHVSQVS